MCAQPARTIRDKGGPDADQPKEATYLLYMVGQNDLKQYLNANISDMKIGYGKSDINANVLVYADISSVPTLYLIGKDNSGKVQQTTVKDLSRPVFGGPGSDDGSHQ